MMIAALVHGFPPFLNAGAEHMLFAMMKRWVAAGEECVVCLESPYVPGSFPDYELDGVRVTRSLKPLLWADAIITHLDRTYDAEKFCQSTGTPLIHLIHNEMTLNPWHVDPDRATAARLLIANTQWIAEAMSWWDRTPIQVCHPPVWHDDYRVKTSGECATLVNGSWAKGGGLVVDLAKACPEIPFLIVQGSYGPQVPVPDLPNLTHWPTQTDARRIYAVTRVALMPSTYESWGRVAIEAACSGIPTLANDTPGLREALGSAGLFPKGWVRHDITAAGLDCASRPDAATVDTWAEALREVWADWRTYGAKARRRAALLERNVITELDATLDAIRAL